LSEVLGYAIYGNLSGDLACAMTAHPVGNHDKSSLDIDAEPILIDFTPPPAVALRCKREMAARSCHE
jgi:hypothetical protein